jgi:hypothetical protein
MGTCNYHFYTSWARKMTPLRLGRTLILGGIGYILSTLISYMGFQLSGFNGFLF